MREVKVRSQMYPNWKLVINDDNTVRWVGVERGPLTLHYEDKSFMVLKEAGHQWYYNQYNGMKYEAAKFVVLKKRGPGLLEDVEEMFEFYVKAGADNLHYLKPAEPV